VKSQNSIKYLKNSFGHVIADSYLDIGKRIIRKKIIAGKEKFVKCNMYIFLKFHPIYTT